MFVLSALTFVFGMFGVGASGVVATVSAGDAETCIFDRRRSWMFFVSRTGQSPFPVSILWPDHVWSQQRHFFDHQPLREEGKQTKVKMKAFCLQKIARTCRRDLRNDDAGQCQSAPRRDTNAPDMERRANPLAEFLLNPCLSPLRLHIQVQANQGNRNEREKCPNNG